jgi:hypothetical protein
MARFNLNDYATVEERLRAFWSEEDHKDARIVTRNCTVEKDLWVIEARLYLSAGDQAAELPKTTGWASEVNSDPFALERCETSAIGRMLANYLYSGSKKGDKSPRPSREEMEKVIRYESRDFLSEASKLTDVEKLRILWAEAKAAKAPQQTLDQIKERANALSNSGSERGGIEGSVSGLFEAEADSGTEWAADPKPEAKRGK